MHPGAAALTRRGRGLLVVSLALGLGAYLFGIKELYPMAAAGLMLVLASRAWAASRVWDLRVVRHVRPVRVAVGHQVRVELAVRNHNARRSPVVTIADPFDGGSRWARFAVAPLDPGQTRTGAYQLAAARRGMFSFGPLEIELGDPFGLARSKRIGAAASVLTVHPRLDPLPSRAIVADADRDRRVPLPVLGRSGDEFYGLREYQSGDDLRQVHWMSTARLDTLMIRQPENQWRGRLTIAVDLRSPVHAGPSLEDALSAAGSITAAALRAGMQVRLIGTDGADTGFGTGLRQEASVLDALALAGPHAGGPLSEVLPASKGAGAVTLVTTDAVSATDVAFIATIAGREAATLVVFERSARPSRPLRLDALGPRGRCVRVPAGTSFRTAWEQSTC